MPVDVYTETKEQVAELLESLFGDDATAEEAARFVSNPTEVLAEHDITEESLDGVDLQTLFAEAAAEADIPSSAREALEGFRPIGGGASQTTELVTHVSTVTYATYEGDEQFTTLTESFTTFDNSVDVDVDGDFDGDLEIENDQDVETNEVNADDGAVVNQGDGDVNAATGEESIAVGDDLEGVANTGDDNAIVGDDGQANTGAGAVQVGDDLEDSLVNTGEVGDGAVLNNGDIEAPVVTGENDGVIADGDVDDTVVGDDNQVANVDGENEGVINFGDGDVSNINDSELDDTAVATGGNATNVSDNEDSAVSLGGDAQNISNNDVEDGALAGDDANNASDNELEEGSALSAGGDAETEVEDSFNDTDVDADESIVNTQQGSGELEQEDTELDD